MAGCVLGIAYSLLQLASFLQGAENVELFFYETMEAEVGENITLPCFVKDATDQKIVSIKWMKNEGTNLVVYNPDHGTHRYWPNVTIQEKRNDTNKLIGSYLHLPWVNKWDSGIYICELLKFPTGSFISKTKLTVKDQDKLMCNTSETVELYSGDNATIHCMVNSYARYMWTKDEKLVAENESLELWQVTEAHGGVYKLTVNIGDKSLHKDFIISVLTATTSLRTVSTRDKRDSTQNKLTTLLSSGPSTKHHGWTFLLQ